jgi:hypothetical protein
MPINDKTAKPNATNATSSMIASALNRGGVARR